MASVWPHVSFHGLHRQLGNVLSSTQRSIKYQAKSMYLRKVSRLITWPLILTSGMVALKGRRSKAKLQKGSLRPFSSLVRGFTPIPTPSGALGLHCMIVQRTPECSCFSRMCIVIVVVAPCAKSIQRPDHHQQRCVSCLGPPTGLQLCQQCRHWYH